MICTFAWPGYQSAEIHLLVRSLLAKRMEWAVELLVTKLDIFEAYGTLR